jgi:hypothetical protein
MLKILCVASSVAMIMSGNLKAAEHDVSEKRVGLRVMSTGSTELEGGHLEITVKGKNAHGELKKIYSNIVDLRKIEPTVLPQVILMNMKLNMNFQGIKEIEGGETTVKLTKDGKTLRENSYKYPYHPSQVNGYRVQIDYSKIDIIPTSDLEAKTPIHTQVEAYKVPLLDFDNDRNLRSTGEFH